jgi:hypothetical protein
MDFPSAVRLDLAEWFAWLRSGDWGQRSMPMRPNRERPPQRRTISSARRGTRVGRWLAAPETRAWLTAYRSRFWEGFSGDDGKFKGTNDINGGADNVNNLGCRHLISCRSLQSVPVGSALFIKPVNDVINAGIAICHKGGSNMSGIEVSGI